MEIVTPTFHEVARCRWCHKRFRLIYQRQWICESDECASRCIAQAILKSEKPQDGRTPYFFLPLPLQVDIEESPVKRLLVHGPAGISKSFGGRMHLYKRCRQFAGYRALLLRVTLKQLALNHLQFMGSEARQLGDAEFKGGNMPHMTFDNDSVMHAGYCDDVNDIGQHIGPEWDEVLMEEAVHFLPKALQEIPARDRGSDSSRDVMYPLGIFEGRSRLLTNPGGRGMQFLLTHYIHRNPNPAEFPEYKPEWYGHISGDIRDNPYLAATYKSSVLGGHTKKRFQQLAEGRWDVFEGQFLPDWNPDRHVQRLS